MAIRRYTAEELYHLRTSPLVQKPDNLPAIEQWIEYVYIERDDGARERLRIPHSDAAQQQQQHQQQQQQQSQQPQQSTASKKLQRPGLTASASLGDGSPMGSFSTGQRPGLSRPVTSRNGEDVSLGPPRTMFPSSRNIPRLADFPDRSGTTPAPADGSHAEEAETARSRFFADRQQRRITNDKDGRDARESWTRDRERRALAGDSDDHGREKSDRHGRHEKDQDGERRNGYGERHDTRWGGSRDDKRHNGERTGGWRDREQQRRERDGERGHVEKDPEWFVEDAVVKKDQELGMGMARTQEDFQKWKESMGKPRKDLEKEEPLEPEPGQQQEPEARPANVAPLKLDGFNLPGWGANDAAASTNNAPAPATKPGSKAKASRFASMFKPAEVTTPPPEPFVAPQAPPVEASAEDKVGFNRVLQMLGSTKIAPSPNPTNDQAPASPPANKTGFNGRPKSRFTDLFEARSPERLQSPPENPLRGDGTNSSIGRRMVDEPEHAGVFDPMQMPRGMNARQGYPPGATMTPETPGIPFNALREQQPPQSRPASGRINDFGPMFDPPARGAATPDNNIQNLLAQQQRSQRTAFDSNGSQQLLNLLKTDAARTSDKPNDAHPAGQQNFPPELFQRFGHENKTPAEPHAPKPRMPNQPPGLFEEQLMRNFAQQQQEPHQHQQQQQQQQQLLLQQMQENAQSQQRRAGQRAPGGAAPPPGFFDEQQILLQQQQQQLRRNYEVQQQQHFQHQPQSSQGSIGVRRMSGVPHIPQMGPPMPHPQQQPQQPFYNGPPPGGDFAGGPPPPGFNPHMVRHHPPGFHNLPGMFQPQQQQQQAHPPPQQPRNDQLPSPAGYPPPPPPGFYGMPPPQGPPLPQQQQQQQQQHMRGPPPPPGGGGGGYGVQILPPGIGEPGRR